MIKKVFLIVVILNLLTGCIAMSKQTMSDVTISKSDKRGTIKIYNWLNKNFGKELKEATKNTPFSVSLLSAIVMQESGYYLLGNNRIDSIDIDILLKNCILDATGEVHGTRSAFPRNTDEFRRKYGDKITDELIAEANRAREFRGYKQPKQWVYAGYGLFQFDLQEIQSKQHKEFFLKKQWYSFDKILEKVMIELQEKYKKSKGDLWKSIRLYNGSGNRAIRYANLVFAYKKIIEQNNQ